VNLQWQIKMEAIILIPIYKSSMTTLEELSLRQCLNIMKRHSFSFFCPQSLDISAYLHILSEYQMHAAFIRFPNNNFHTIEDYSLLLLTKKFYSYFLDYDFMLIYQLDSWVFRDDLNYWCAKNYDYIGAPWFEFSDKLNKFILIEPSGNGGFSLRKITTFVQVTSLIDCFRIYKNRYLKMQDDLFKNYNEDRIIVDWFPRFMLDFKIAQTHDAMRFSFERSPEILFSLTKELPFGCHDFATDFKFWKNYINIDENICLLRLRELHMRSLKKKYTSVCSKLRRIICKEHE
jgi:hypothetical protein